ncbi:MAG: aminotransferase class I/II-fold pyridoxal phosphate-dependent enzyme [Deltaproteobacteria bacterium]|nr:aminotransferase class I/II-fold pyridoxal phosphate-dependent enzyme [Deltaproteobacteria bacterium]
MGNHKVDLRSDTVTQPGEGMRRAIAEAEVGDDVFRDDPTVLALESRVAKMLGKERGLFFPSGTMSNAAAIGVHAEPGSEVLCEENCHIFNYESGHAAALSGVQLHIVRGHNGALSPETLKRLVHKDDNVHFAPTRLVTIENTHNRCGGRIIPLATMRALYDWTREERLPIHLDGARLWNASVALGIPVGDLAQYADTVSVCLSKGLGAPAGSVLCGTDASITKALRLRKRFGGAMRQAGILAAAGLYALDHNLGRLAADHANAKRFAEAVAALPGIDLNPAEVETNIVIFRVEEPWTAPEMQAVLEEYGIRMLATAPDKIRAVFNLMVSSQDTDRAIDAFRAVLAADKAASGGGAS